MPFGVRDFSNPSRIGFNTKFSRKLEDADQFNKPAKWEKDSQPFGVARKTKNYKNSEVNFYNTDSLWSRWRRGYELYTATQSFLGSTASERGKRGDYRCLLYTSPSPRDGLLSRMPSSA